MCTYHTLYTHENQESSTSSCGLNRFAIWHEIWLPLVSILHASQPRQVRKGQRSGFFLRKLSQKVSSAQLISTFILAHASTCRLVEILPVILPPVAQAVCPHAMQWQTALLLDDLAPTPRVAVQGMLRPRCPGTHEVARLCVAFPFATSRIATKDGMAVFTSFQHLHNFRFVGAA